MRTNTVKGFVLGIVVAVVLLITAITGAVADRLFEIKPLDLLIQRAVQDDNSGQFGQRFIREESTVISIAENVSPSVVTVAIQRPERRVLEFDPFEGFRARTEGGEPQDIGSGFIVSEKGLVITNKHVVNKEAEYKVITQDGNEYDVLQISRDPGNDLAVLRIEADNLKAVELGDSDGLRVGQFVMAIGTALGEFRHTVTTGVISGLGRGITAGSVFQGYVERLDDVIQTDAAINPGNSGGPLLNSAGQVIGVNVAVASRAENVGFAIPVNILKDALQQFEASGNFASKPYLGVEYQMISQQAALLNEVPQGALVVNVIPNSPAQTAGILSNDIIISMDDVRITEDNDLASVISERSAGENVTIELWRNGETIQTSAVLSQFSE